MARSPSGSTETLEQIDTGFSVSISGFDGPFDLLLTLIGKRELDITEVSLSRITDEFIAYLSSIDTDAELDEASEFVVVAATLLDLKVAGLLPQGELVDAEDVALLEARDLLFARLLQYRAFKHVSEWFAERMETETSRHVRTMPLDEQHRGIVPDLVWSIALEQFAALAESALSPRPEPRVGLGHLHTPLVSVREQAALVVARLRGTVAVTFRQLIAGADSPPVVIARFLAVLELYRGSFVAFEQGEPLGELTIRWSGGAWSDDALVALGGDYGS